MKKKILSLMLLVLLFSSTLSQAFGEINHYLNLQGLTIEIDAPDEAKVNEEFNVRLIVHPSSKIYVKSLTVTFNSFYEKTLLYQQNVSEEFLKIFSLKATTYGKIFCIIEISYVRWKGTQFEESYEETFKFDLTDITDKTREELERDYNSLNDEVQEEKKRTEIFFLTTIILFLLVIPDIYLDWKLEKEIEKEKRKSGEQKEEGSIKR